MKFIELKQKIKELSKEITKKKSQRKQCLNGYVPGLDDLRYEARHHHIAYCLLRGRTMEQIEPNTRKWKSSYYIDKIVESVEPKEAIAI